MEIPIKGVNTEPQPQALVDLREPRFFIAGGTLAADAASYLRRGADDLLLRTLLEGQYAHVLIRGRRENRPWSPERRSNSNRQA